MALGQVSMPFGHHALHGSSQRSWRMRPKASSAATELKREVLAPNGIGI